MPELPEVETIKLGLQKYLVGHTIEDVEVRLPRILSGDVKDIIGAKFVAIKRYGKGLVLELDNGYCLAIHIKLTGQIVYRDKDVSKYHSISKAKIGELPNKFTHLIFHLDHNALLYYNDQRQFGWVKILKTTDIKTLPFFKELGPEPPVAKAMEGQALLTEEMFKKILSSSKMSIKPLLIDQKKIGGIGNIYSNDSLFLAKIDPRRPANSLTPEEIKRLFHTIETVMKKGLETGGASELTFVNALGEEGNYQKHFQIYGKEGKPCVVCGTTIKKFFLGGRGTYMCTKCQK